MSDLQELISGWAQPGRVSWLGARPERRSPVLPLIETMIGCDGLSEDRSRTGKRAVTVVQAEHLAAIGSFLGQNPVAPDLLRRNIVVEGINLAALKGREVQVGEAVLQLTVICAPCSRMEATFGRGGYSAVRGHGGWCAEVVRPGRVCLGDAVQPID